MQGHTRLGLEFGAGRWGALAAAAAALGIGAGPAHASTLSNDSFLESSGVSYVADPGETNTPMFSGLGTDTLTVNDPGVLLIKAMPPNCIPGFGTASCTQQGASLFGISVTLGDGNDSFTAPAGSHARADDGPGNDTIDLSAATVSLAAAGMGADVLRGNAPFGDTAIISYESRVAPVNLTLAGGADDGQAGEGDDVRGFNDIRMGSGNDTVVGTGANELVNGGAGTDTIDTAGGDDLVWPSPGGDSVNTGDGNDTVLSDGDGGAATLQAGPGNDFIAAGGDGSVVFAGPGDDQIHAVGPTRQKIHCGSGFDTVEASVNDVVSGDCEQVTYL